jgi:formamidopyrimidine-DNA glycosylase
LFSIQKDLLIMPELPEVNTVQQYFNATPLHQPIEQVEVRDDHIIRNVSGERFIDLLTGRTFAGSYRRGKYLFAELDNGHHVQLHLGMSGDLKYYSDPEDEPKHPRFFFRFDNGFHLAFDCPRKLARVVYVENLEHYIKEKGLGEDAQRIGKEEFIQLMEGKQGTLKGFLMNQKYIAGVGNLYADEICYQARVHPASIVANIEMAARRLIFEKMQEIFRFAVDKNAHYRRYPDDWLWNWRKEGHPCPENGSTVRKMQIAGRTTYFCGGLQKKF